MSGSWKHPGDCQGPHGLHPRPQAGATAHGSLVQYLAEFKICGAGLTCYPMNRRNKAMDRQSRLLPGEYREKNWPTWTTSTMLWHQERRATSD